MSYLYLLLSVFCSLILVHLLKLGESRQQRMLHTFTINYFVASMFAFAVSGLPPVALITETFGHPVLLFALVTGAIYISNFLFYSKSIHLNGMGVSVTAMRLSLLVPVFLSVWLYREELTAIKIVGLVMVLTALGLIVQRGRKIQFKNVDAVWLLLIIFLLTGLADSSLKIYEEDFSTQLNELHFMGLVFFCAFIIGLIISLFQKGRGVNKNELVTGICIGIPNLYSSVFLIYALQEIDGAVAYPTVNILNVVGGTLLGLWFWKDRVSKLQWAGIGLSVIAIMLLL